MRLNKALDYFGLHHPGDPEVGDPEQVNRIARSLVEQALHEGIEQRCQPVSYQRPEVLTRLCFPKPHQIWVDSTRSSTG
jgi:hypothetical protein